MVSPAEVREFWTAVGPQGWYRQDDALDAEIREKFLDIWQTASTADCESKALEPWFETPEAMLGLIVLLDQFPRNMFRGDPRSFASDARARAVAKQAIDRGWDQRIEGEQRQFFYMPLMHSECLEDQDRAIRLFMTRMGHAPGNLVHAKAHREIIRRFGRFPFRNAALKRQTTQAEAEFLKNGGYGQIVQALQAAA